MGFPSRTGVLGGVASVAVASENRMQNQTAFFTIASMQMEQPYTRSGRGKSGKRVLLRDCFRGRDWAEWGLPRREAVKRTMRSGFTLVEVLTVLAILALLAALIGELAGVAQKKAARDRAEAEIAQLESFLADCRMKFGRVPPDRNALAEALADPLLCIGQPKS